jgi:hypothetical protein
MSIFQKRLLVVTDMITSLDIRIRDLERLRDQNKKAQLSARRLRPKSRRKRTRISNDKGRLLCWPLQAVTLGGRGA